MKEKGFAPLFLILVVSLLTVGYIVGNLAANYSITVTKVGSDQTTQPTSSPNPTTKFQNKLFDFFTKPSATPTSQPQTTPQLEKSPQSPTTTSPVIAPALNPMITASGGYSYAGQNLTYIFTFSRGGGDVTGNVDGVCNGPVSGKYNGGDGGSVSGQIPVTCQVGFVNQNYLLNYDGKVYLKDKRVDINWTGNIPFFTNSGSFSLYFQ